MSRPKGDTQTRQSLLEAAKTCFTKLGYERVSTRQIARIAGVDAAMIRYYFGSKAGLFEAMVLETIKPMLDKLKERHDLLTTNDPLTLMQTYYQVMSSNPNLPKLLMQVMNHGDSDEAYLIIKGILSTILSHASNWFSPHNPQWQLRDDVNPELARFSMISLMVFPLIAPQHLIDQFGIELSEANLEKLARHNQQVLQHGLLASKED
ncbi:TetR/AcrR family transcriptional regulator [Vibrio sp.]|nr:TetR/AcrR family transcriptional regulator [Vibrio sp.]